MNKILEEALKNKEQLIEWRRYLHANPELGHELPLTTKLVKDALTKMGLEHVEIIPSGVTATIKGDKPGKTILLRADMDALPMCETTGLDFASKNNNMHACGHDMHATMLLGAAAVLLKNKDKIEGNVKLMFQPAEETTGGAKPMVKAGVLTNPTVDAAFDVHVMSQLPFGAIAYNGAGGYSSASIDAFEITVTGKGGHGAQPEGAIDPINVGAHIVIALQTLMAREKSASDVAVLTVCQFEAGSAFNIIPGSATLKGSMRTYGKELRIKLRTRIEEIVEYTAKTFGATASIKYLADVPSIITDKKMIDQTVSYLKQIQPFHMIDNFVLPATDDFAYVSEEVPSVFFMIGAMPTDPKQVFPLHNTNVVLNEDILPVGTAMFAHCAIEWLKENK